MVGRYSFFHVVSLLIGVSQLGHVCVAGGGLKELTIEQARVCVTGHDTNPPDPFPGWGGFGWPGNIARLPNGELLLAHSAGYWHVSFAQPRLIEKETRKRWLARNWPLDFLAPTGGRAMLCRSADNGKSWAKPETVSDSPWSDSPCGLLLCRDGTLLCCINVQSSWYGFDQPPPQFRNDLDGLNTKQCVVRSIDGGKTWSKPIWIESPGKYYERSHSQPIQLPDGNLLWSTYCADSRNGLLFGAIHGSDDSGKTWKTISTVHRKSDNVDEPAIALLKNDELLMISRPDGGLFRSRDRGVTWKETGRIVASGRLKAPRLFVLSDGTIVCVCTYNGTLHVFLSKDQGIRWTRPILLDASAYGYPGGFLNDDETMLVSYCSKGQAPSRIYLVRFEVNDDRTGIKLLAL